MIDKIDKRVYLGRDTYEKLMNMSSELCEKETNDREKLGKAIDYILDKLEKMEQELIVLDPKTKERISVLVKNGVYDDEPRVVSDAVENLYNIKREEIMEKIQSL
jgi:hypothetical protein